MNFTKKGKTVLTDKQRNRWFIASCIIVSLLTTAVLVIMLHLDFTKAIDNQSLNTAVSNVLKNHENHSVTIFYALYYVALYVCLIAFAISSAWIIATQTEKRWLALLLCNSLIFMTFMNVYVSAFMHAGWKDIYELYSTIVTTVSTVVMATTVISFGINLKNSDKKNEQQVNTEE